MLTDEQDVLRLSQCFQQAPGMCAQLLAGMLSKEQVLKVTAAVFPKERSRRALKKLEEGRRLLLEAGVPENSSAIIEIEQEIWGVRDEIGED